MFSFKNKDHLHLLSLLKFFLGWPLSILTVFFIFRIIFSQQKNIPSSLLDNPNILLLLLGITCFFLFYLTRSFVCKLILKELGYNIPIKTVSFLWETSELRRIIPGKLWPYLSRITLFSKINVPAKITMKALFVELESLILASFIISILGAIFFSSNLLPNISYVFFIPGLIIIFLTTLIFIDRSILGRFLKWKIFLRITSLFPEFPPHKNLGLLLASILYLFLLGFGTYFTIVSVVFLSPEFFIEFSIFFVFSFLVGYLSFITPMGLGVRESIMVVGLSKSLSLGVAGIVSIFARIILLISEVLFLFFTYFWEKSKSKFVTTFENFISHHKQEVMLGILISLYFLYFAATSMLRYDNFYTGRFDLGNMDQTVWNTIHGRIFQMTDPNGTEIVSRLAFHADFILVLLSPFYLLWEHAKTLILVQTAVLSLGAIFVFAIAKNVLKNRNLSLLFAFLFLFNPAVQYTNLYDFHAVTLATTFLLGTFYFLLKKRYILFLVFALLAAITKEQIWVIIALFGAYIFFFQSKRHSGESRDNRGDSRISMSNGDSGQARMTRRKVFGITVAIISILTFYFLIWHIMPNIRGAEHFALSFYSDFGQSPTDVVKNVFLSPQQTISTFFQKDQLGYLNQLFLPLGFLSLFSPLYLVFALPDLFINLLSSNPKLHQIYYQYSAAITPFVFISAIYGIRNLKVWFPKMPYTIFTAYCLLLTAYAAYSFGPLPYAKKPNIDMFTKSQENRTEIEKFLSSIPQYYSVAATNNIGSHLSQREKIYTLPIGLDKADMVIFLLNDQKSKDFFKDHIKKITNNKAYGIFYKINDTFIVFEKQAAP